MKSNPGYRGAGAAGFTLVELLVVMAIIAILASIVVPNVAKYITRSRMTNALSEIKNADTSFTGMLSDAQVSNFQQFFDKTKRPWTDLAGMDSLNRVYQAQFYYTGAFYELLRLGKGANRAAYGLRDEVVNKLGTNYMVIDKDPWGNLYNVYAGPWRGGGDPPFRIKQPESDIPGGPAVDPQQLPPDGRVAYIAPANIPIYIWSSGQNLISGQRIYGNFTGNINGVPIEIGYRADQEVEEWGSGDDITNWDSNQSWLESYS